MKKQYYIPFIYAITMVLLALTDALFFNGNKSASKFIEEITHVIFICLPIYILPIKTWRYAIKLLLTYIFIRIALFDLAFNIFANQDVNYIGTTDAWNNILRHFNLKSFHFWSYRIFFIGITALVWIRQKD